VAQGVGSEFNPQYCKKREKKKKDRRGRGCGSEIQHLPIKSATLRMNLSSPYSADPTQDKLMSLECFLPKLFGKRNTQTLGTRWRLYQITRRVVASARSTARQMGSRL
jgi:hypothetical protein